MKQQINPQETKRAFAFEMWMTAPMPMVTLVKTMNVSKLLKISKKTGVTFNTLSNIFDLQSRHLKSELSLVGLDLKKDVANSFNGTLDEVLTILENTKPAEVAVEKVGITFNNNDEAVRRFLQWVLENGTKYNHQYGLLNLDQKVAEAQTDKVQSKLTAQK